MQDSSGASVLPLNPDLAVFCQALREIQVEKFTPLSELLLRANAQRPVEGVYVERFNGVLGYLQTLGAVDIKSTEGRGLEVCYVSEGASDFVSSTALCAKEGTVAINTWDHKIINDEPAWGHLLRHIEQTRAYRPQQGTVPEVIRREEVVVIVIKTTSRRHGKQVELFLFQDDKDSGHFNFIGGKRHGNETKLQTAERKIHNELGLGSDEYSLEPLEMIGRPDPVRKISHESAIYSEYSYDFFHAVRISGRAQMNVSNRWFTFDELMRGKGPNGEPIMAHKEITGALRTRLDPAKYPKGLQDLPLSVPSPEALAAAPREEWWKYLSVAELIGVIAALVTILGAVLWVLGHFVALL